MEEEKTKPKPRKSECSLQRKQLKLGLDGSQARQEVTRSHGSWLGFLM